MRSYVIGISFARESNLLPTKFKIQGLEGGDFKAKHKIQPVPCILNNRLTCYFINKRGARKR